MLSAVAAVVDSLIATFSASFVDQTVVQVWPSGKALGRLAEGPQFDSVSVLRIFKSCGLWTLALKLCHLQLMKH